MPLRCPRRVRATAVLLAVAGLLAGCAGKETAAEGVPVDPGVAQTTAGAVRGTVAADHRYFAGIPYAAAPLGALRWQPPAPVAPWTGFRDATRPGARCIQDTSSDVDHRPPSEDCLTLNVWTPPPAGDARPVMVWIHGGSFLNGSGDIYRARQLASRGVVVVTMNYRLGALGFLAHPALGSDGEIGNYGLADQQAALRWVRDNIAEFGGDPDNVTIAGESAGGMAVCDHLVAPGSRGLFSAAIIQSAPCQAQYDLPAAQQASTAYASGIGCADPLVAAQCLRSLPADRFRAPLTYAGFGTERLSGPVAGTPALPENSFTAITSGKAARVPVMIGTTEDEFALFAALQFLRGRPFDAAHYPELLAEVFGPHAAAVAAHYPPDRYGGNVALAYSAAVTAADFACVADRMADALSGQPVYAYEFGDDEAPAPEPLREAPFPVGAAHSLELRYLFDVGGAPPLSPAQQRLSDEMIDYWVRFVATGSPGPDWPELTTAVAGERMWLQPDASHVVTDFEQRHQCAFWGGLPS